MQIPIHNFAFDDDTSIPFRLETLDHKNHYDVDVPHRHNYYEIFIFNAGGGEHIIDFNGFPINDQSLHFISPGQVHQVNRELKSDGFVIMFSREFTHEGGDNKNLLYELPFFHNFTDNPTIDLTDDDHKTIMKIFSDIQDEYDSNQLFNSDILQSYLNILLLKSKRLYQFSDESDASDDQNLTRKFIRTLEINYTQKHQVQEYAELMEMSPNQLNDLTKSTLGKTASEMIQERLILESKRLLMHSSMTAKEISYHLNFSDPAYFSRFFKSKTGFSPNEFKKVGMEKYKS